MYRWHRLAGPEGDGRHAYVNTQGAFLGPNVALVERATDGNGPGRFVPVAAPLLEHLLRKGYGVPVDCKRLAGNLNAVANALDAGDGTRAAMALLHAGLPPLPNEAAALRLVKTNRALRGSRSALGKYSPDQPRVPAGAPNGGEWTAGGGAATTPAPANPTRTAQSPLFLFEEPPVVVRPPLPEFPTDATKPPGPGWIWKGKPGSNPGDAEGNWYNPETGESLHPDLNHEDPIGPHWDYHRPTPGKEKYRWFPDGRLELAA